MVLAYYSLPLIIAAAAAADPNAKPSSKARMGRYVDEHDPSYPLVCALLLGFDAVVCDGP